MKTLGFILLGLLGVAAASAQVRITSFDYGGHLAWSNQLCTPRPVYEILWANSPTGSWQHLTFVTNQTSFATTNPWPAGASATFYKLAWVDDEPLSFNYTFFDDGLDCPWSVVSCASPCFHRRPRETGSSSPTRATWMTGTRQAPGDCGRGAIQGTGSWSI
jgi:hypothetical protein